MHDMLTYWWKSDLYFVWILIQECWQYLSADKQEEVIDYCLDVWDDPDQYEYFLEYVKHVCYYYSYTYVDVPTCNGEYCVQITHSNSYSSHNRTYSLSPEYRLSYLFFT